ncbi:MAG: cobalamin-dependent protein [Acidobacteriota bacterium]|nr:cobalamin-dependent protein [Acidobacteriota bacterium]
MRLNSAGLAASCILKERRDAIAGRVTSLYFETHPELERRWKGARQKCTEDNRYHLDYLCEALSFGRSALFTEYAAWAAALLAGLNIPGEALVFNLELLRTTITSELDDAGGALAAQYLDAALAKLEGPVPALAGGLEGTGRLDVLARDYLAALLRGEQHTASRLIMAAVDGGTSIQDIYLLIFERVQHEVGRLWQANRMGVAQEHYCTACTQVIMSQLSPRIFSSEKNGHRLVVTCVGGDLHELGARMVADFFEMEGWDSYFLGANTPIAGTLQQVAERAPHVLAISATLSFHIQAVADLIAATRAAGSRTRILVGGAPFNSLTGLWKDVGADGFAPDAADAVALAQAWRT